MLNLMQKIRGKQIPILEELFCVVEIPWENKTYCPSHSHYPVTETRLPDELGNLTSSPSFSRYSLIVVRNFDGLCKDESTSTWVVTGLVEPLFPGQQAGLKSKS